MDGPSPLDHCYDVGATPWDGDDQEDLDLYGIWTALHRFRSGEPYLDERDSPDVGSDAINQGQSFVCTLQKLYNALRSEADDPEEAVHCRGFRLGERGVHLNKDGTTTPRAYCHEVCCPTCWIASFRVLCRLLAGLSAPQVQIRYTDVLPISRIIDGDVRSAILGKGKGQRWSPIWNMVVIGVDPSDRYQEPGLRYAGLFVPDPARKDQGPTALRGWTCTSSDDEESFHIKSVTTPSDPIGVNSRTLIDRPDLDLPLISTRAMEAWVHIAFPPPLLYRWPAFFDIGALTEWIDTAERSSRGTDENRHRVSFQAATAAAYGGNAGALNEFEPFRLDQEPEWLQCIDAACEIGLGFNRPDPSEYTGEAPRDLPPETRAHERRPFHLPWLDNLFPDRAGPLWGSGAALIGQQSGGKTTLCLLMCIAQAAHGRRASYRFHHSVSRSCIHGYAKRIYASYVKTLITHGIETGLRSEAETFDLLTLAPVAVIANKPDLSEIALALDFVNQPEFLAIDDLNLLVTDQLIAEGLDNQLRGSRKLQLAKQFAAVAECRDSFVVLGDQLDPNKIKDAPFTINISDTDAESAPRLCEPLRYCFALGPLKQRYPNYRTFGIPRTLDDHQVVGNERIVLVTSDGPYIDHAADHRLDGIHLIVS